MLEEVVVDGAGTGGDCRLKSMSNSSAVASLGRTSSLASSMLPCYNVNGGAIHNVGLKQFETATHSGASVAHDDGLLTLCHEQHSH